VLPQVGEQRLRCPCHEGYYALSTGKPIAGPPQRSLTRIVLEKRGQLVYAVRLE
jgi:Rieske Fe-S protein